MDKLVEKVEILLTGNFFQPFNIERTKIRGTWTDVHGSNHGHRDISPEHKALVDVFSAAMAVVEARKDYRNLYEKIYAFPKSGKTHYPKKPDYALRTEDIIPLNVSGEELERFMLRHLGPTAKSVWKSHSKIVAATHSKIILLGATGSGKTTFLNYLFTKYNDKLDDAGVIWVRVDLMKVHHAIHPLGDAAKGQLAYIVKNYYEPLLKEFQNEMLKCGEDKTDVFVYCDKKDHDQLGTSDHRFLRFHSRLFEFVSANKAIIFIFDGLDKVNSTDEIFEKHMCDLRKMVTDEHYKAMTIFVMRDSSHVAQLQQTREKENEISTDIRGKCTLYRLLPVGIAEILEARMLAMGLYCDDPIDAGRDSFFELCSDSDAEVNVKLSRLKERIKLLFGNGDAKYFFTVFFRFLHRGLRFADKSHYKTDWDISDLYDSIESVSGNNSRRALLILKNSFKIFISYTIVSSLEIDEVVAIGRSLLDGSIVKNKSLGQKYNAILNGHYMIVRYLLGYSSTYRHQYAYTVDLGSDSDKQQRKNQYSFSEVSQRAKRVRTLYASITL